MQNKLDQLKSNVRETGKLSQTNVIDIVDTIAGRKPIKLQKSTIVKHFIMSILGCCVKRCFLRNQKHKKQHNLMERGSKML